MYPSTCSYCGLTVDTALDASLVIKIARRHVGFGDDGEPHGQAEPVDLAF